MNRFVMTFAIITGVTAIIIFSIAAYPWILSEKDTATEIGSELLPTPVVSQEAGLNRNNLKTLKLDFNLFSNSNSTESLFNITQGSSLKMEVLLSSSSDDEFTIPLYLSIGAFENQPCAKVITSPPSPYPNLPWPGHKDSADMANPFEASFDSNPLTLEPNGNKTAILTITALEETLVGKYAMVIETGGWKQTGLGSIAFQLIVKPS